MEHFFWGQFLNLKYTETCISSSQKVVIDLRSFLFVLTDLPHFDVEPRLQQTHCTVLMYKTWQSHNQKIDLGCYVTLKPQVD